MTSWIISMINMLATNWFARLKSFRRLRIERISMLSRWTWVRLCRQRMALQLAKETRNIEYFTKVKNSSIKLIFYLIGSICHIWSRITWFSFMRTERIKNCQFAKLLWTFMATRETRRWARLSTFEYQNPQNSITSKKMTKKKRMNLQRFHLRILVANWVMKIS